MGATCCTGNDRDTDNQHETQARYPCIKFAKNRSKRDCIDNFNSKGEHFPSLSAFTKIEAGKMNLASPFVQEVLDELGEYPEKFVIASQYDMLPTGGPYRYPDGSSYRGQFMDTLPHG